MSRLSIDALTVTSFETGMGASSYLIADGSDGIQCSCGSCPDTGGTGGGEPPVYQTIELQTCGCEQQLR